MVSATYLLLLVDYLNSFSASTSFRVSPEGPIDQELYLQRFHIGMAGRTYIHAS